MISAFELLVHPGVNINVCMKPNEAAFALFLVHSELTSAVLDMKFYMKLRILRSKRARMVQWYDSRINWCHVTLTLALETEKGPFNKQSGC